MTSIFGIPEAVVLLIVFALGIFCHVCDIRYKKSEKENLDKKLENINRTDEIYIKPKLQREKERAEWDQQVVAEAKAFIDNNLMVICDVIQANLFCVLDLGFTCSDLCEYLTKDILGPKLNKYTIPYGVYQNEGFEYLYNCIKPLFEKAGYKVYLNTDIAFGFRIIIK